MYKSINNIFSHGIVHNDLFFSSGVTAVGLEDELLHPAELFKQTSIAIKKLSGLMNEFDFNLDDLGKLVVYYVNNGEIDQHDYIDFIAQQLNLSNLPALTMVPLTHLYHPDLMVVFDGYGKKSSSTDHPIKSTTSAFNQAVQQDELIFIGALTSVDDYGNVLHKNDIVKQSHVVLEKLDDLLKAYGASRRDIVKINNWYVGGGSADEWAESARVRANYYPEPGPVATGLPLKTLYPQGLMIQTDCWAMLSKQGKSMNMQHSWPRNHWDWPIHLPFKHGLKCGDLIFTGGQVSMDSKGNVINLGDIIKQSHASMKNIARVLGEFDADLSQITKLNAFYMGGAEPEVLQTNLDIRASYFSKPGPASTSIPLNHLCYEGMLAEFEVIAIDTRKDEPGQ